MPTYIYVLSVREKSCSLQHGYRRRSGGARRDFPRATKKTLTKGEKSGLFHAGGDIDILGH